MKRSLLLVLLFSSLLSHSQKSEEILKSVPAGLMKDDIFVGLITLKDKSHVLLNTNDDQEFTFQRYDKNLKPIRLATTTLVYGIAKKKNVRSIIQLKDKFYLSFGTMDKNDYLYALYVIEFDPYEMVFKGNMKTVFRKEQLARGTVNQIPNMHFGYRNLPNTVNCFYKDIFIEKTSADSSKFMVVRSIADSASFEGNKMLKYLELEVVSDTEKVHVTVFDTEFKKLWQREIIFRNKLKVEDYAVGNDGKLLVLAKLGSGKSKFETNYEIYTYRDSISKPDTTCPNFVARTMLDGKFFSADGINFRITGTFQDKQFGFYSASLYDTLPHDGESHGDLKTFQKKEDLFLREIVRTADGKFKVIFEEYKQSKFVNDKEIEARTEKGVINEEFGDLHVMSMSDKGNIEWVAIVPKKQVDIKHASSVFTFMPYKSVAGQHTIRLFYIDNEKNFGPDWKTDYELGRFACLASVSVGPAGNIAKYKVGKIDALGSLKTKFHHSGHAMYTENHLNRKNVLYKLKID